MAVNTLSRIFSLTAARKVLLQSPHYCHPLPKPSHNLSLSLLTHHTCQPQTLTKFCFQVSPGVRVKSAETYCQTIASCRNARKNLLQGIHRVVRKVHKLSVKRGRMAWCGASLGMAFLAPSVMHQTQKEVPVLPVQPEMKRKKRGWWWSQLLLSVYEFLRVCLRAVRLLATFTPILMLYPITYLGRTATDVWWGLLLTAIEVSGPILMKLGQWASTRRDLFPDSCCSQFSRLQRRIKPHSWLFTTHQMKRAFGSNWRKIFVKFDNDGNPIGSGCVAQVYKVWMNTEAILDEELLEEIVSDMDEDITDLEGLEVMGLRQLFGLGLGLLCLGSKTDPDNLRALKEFQQLREEWRNIEKQKPVEQAAQDTPEPSSPPEAGEELLSVDQGSDNLPSEKGEMDVSPCQKEGTAPTQQVEDMEDALTHQLVEEWQEAEVDKSFPLCEGPPEDLEGLVPVAVKVLHPAIAKTFRRDLRILRACASLITTLVPSLRWLSLPQCVDEFGQVMAAQINLRTEADNLEKFSENFSDIPFIKFPRPLRPYVTAKVLVETFEEGESMLDVIRATEGGDTDQLKKHLAQIGVDALLKMACMLLPAPLYHLVYKYNILETAWSDPDSKSPGRRQEMPLHVTQPPPFSVTADPSSVASRWKEWKKSFQFYLEATGISSRGQKRALLLHAAGPEVQEIFSTLPEPLNTLELVLTALDTYFSPQVDMRYERVLFRQIKQESDETTDSYVTRLRKLAETCEFHDTDHAILAQVIEKCYSSELRRMALQEKNLTLDKLLQLARAMEAVNRQASIIEGNGNNDKNTTG